MALAPRRPSASIQLVWRCPGFCSLLILLPLLAWSGFDGFWPQELTWALMSDEREGGYVTQTITMGHVQILDTRSSYLPAEILRLIIDSPYYNCSPAVPDFNQTLNAMQYLRWREKCPTLIPLSDLRVLVSHIFLLRLSCACCAFLIRFLHLSCYCQLFCSQASSFNQSPLHKMAVRCIYPCTACGWAHWPFREDRVWSTWAEAVSIIAYSCFEWFCLCTSIPGSACVGGIDRLWIGLWRTSLLMSACTRGNTRALKDGEGGMELHLSVLVTHRVNATS